MDKRSIPEKTEHAVSRMVDGEAVIVEPQNGLVNVANAVGSSLWELADGKRTVEEMACIIGKEYDVTSDVALKDAIEFLGELEAKGLISVRHQKGNAG